MCAWRKRKRNEKVRVSMSIEDWLELEAMGDEAQNEPKPRSKMNAIIRNNWPLLGALLVAISILLVLSSVGKAEDGAPSAPSWNTLACIQDSPYADVWNGTSGADCWNGNGGNDQAYAKGGRDRLNGGNGSDWIEGNGDQDVIWGGHGGDDLFGGNGADYLYAGCKGGCPQSGESFDYLEAGDGKDTIGARNDKVDQINCGPAFDVVYADINDIVNSNCEDVRRA